MWHSGEVWCGGSSARGDILSGIGRPGKQQVHAPDVPLATGFAPPYTSSSGPRLIPPAAPALIPAEVRAMSLRACFLFVALAGSAAAADWPQWRGPNRDGHSADTGLLKTWPAGGPKLLWKVEKLDAVGTGYGSPAVVGDRLFVLGGEREDKEAKEFCVCLSANDGSVLWKTPLETTPGTFQLQGWGRGTRSTPTVDGDRVYALGVMGDLVCLTAADGKPVWKKNLVGDFGGKVPKWGYSESPLVDGDKVVCTPAGKGGMVALNKATGEKVWHCQEFNAEPGYSSIVAADIGGVRQYIQQVEAVPGGGVGVRAKDGKLLWQAGEMKRRTAVIPTPVVYKDHVFFTAGYGAGCELYKLDPDGQGGTKATKVYTDNKVLGNHHGGVVRVGEHMYGHSDTKGGWVCFDFLKGGEDPVWHSTKLGKGSVSFADGELYCYSESDGTLAKIKATPEGWQETGRFTIPKLSPTRPKSGRVWPHPVIANGKMYIRDQDVMYVYDVKGSGAKN